VSLAAEGWLAVAAAGVGTTLLTVRGFGAPRRASAWAAGAVRGLAVALAVIAVFEPVTKSFTRVPGEVLVAAPHGDEKPPADAVVRWPDDAPDAAAALETLRASRDAARPAALTLAARDELGRGRDVAPAARALRSSPGVTPYVRPIAGAAPKSGPGTAPTIVTPAGAVDGIPVTISLDAGDTPFEDSAATLEIEGRTYPVPTRVGARRAA
jgi:hypothetical protein